MNVADKPRILLVDDEEQVLRGIAVHLRKQFEVSQATSGTAGLTMVDTAGPFAVVLSDMRMPGLSGAQFLAEVRRRSPDTVRVLLTGQADLESAIAAINDGQVFRFLTKPAPPDRLQAALAEAVRQHQLLTAERDLLENTLRSSLKVLTDVLALVNPEAFSRASRVHEIVQLVGEHLGLKDTWQIQVAAMLSQLGCVTLAPETVRKAYAGEPLDGAQQESFAAHPQVAHGLIASIPRLETVAEIVRRQMDPLDRAAPNGDPTQWPVKVLGTEILKAALKFDALVARCSQSAAVSQLRDEGSMHPTLLQALAEIRLSWDGSSVLSVTLAELRDGMVLHADLLSASGILLASKGMRVGETLLCRLRNFAASTGIREPIDVLVGAREVRGAAERAPALRR